jgi:hypothetical protein
MLKKFLCLLLIIQHINICVLHAGAGDIKIVYEQGAQVPSHSFVSLSVFEENLQGHDTKLLSATFDTDSYGSRFLYSSRKTTSVSSWMKYSPKLLLGVYFRDELSQTKPLCLPL